MQLNFVLGTAAELIKVYPVISLANERGHSTRIISTGQSRENFLMQYQDFGLDPAALMTMVSSEGDLGRASSALKWFTRAVTTSRRNFTAKTLKGDKSLVVVHGDTLSTLVGARLGSRAGLPVVHIEAGLRSPNLLSPFPEEITRRMVSRMADFHMTPDDRATANLEKARVSGHIVKTGGNTLADAIALCGEATEAHSTTRPFALVNIHRFENLNSPVRWQFIVKTLLQASERHDLLVVMHPQTRYKIDHDKEASQALSRPQIELRDRMPFNTFVGLLKRAAYLITDGGSNQEECSYLGKPCLILRDATERTEGLDSCCVLTRFDRELTDRFLSDPSKYEAAPQPPAQSPSALILDYLETRT